MMELALAVERPDGAYREVAGPGYARARAIALPAVARFGPALGPWGVVRAWGIVDAGGATSWRTVPLPCVVGDGDRVTLDTAADSLTVTPPPPPPPRPAVDETPVVPPDWWAQVTGKGRWQP